jgi:hypothetical protein
MKKSLPMVVVMGDTRPAKLTLKQFSHEGCCPIIAEKKREQTLQTTPRDLMGIFNQKVESGEIQLRPIGFCGGW